MDLLTELLKAQDNKQDISFKFGDQEYTWYFKYLTLLEKVRIDDMTIKHTTMIKEDGSKIEKREKQEHLIPIHTIIEKALDKDGNRLFSHTNPQHFKTIANMPAALASLLAYEMSKDVFGTFAPKAEDGE